jgi:hypothetical protein
MSHTIRRNFWKQTAGLGLVLLIGVVAAVGCGRNEGELPGGCLPQGVTDQETFMIAEVVLTDEPVTLDSTISRPSCGTCPDSVDVDTTFIIPTAIDTVVKITINDRTRADGYQLYRRVGGSDSFEKATIYVAPFKRTFNQAYQIFEAIDRGWRPGLEIEYIARATIMGQESSASPITLNRAFIPAGNYRDLAAVDTLRRIAPKHEAFTDPALVVTSFPDTNDPSGLTQIRECLCGPQWAPVQGASLYRVIIQRTDGVLFASYLTNAPGLDQPILAEQFFYPLTQSSFFWWVEAIDDDSRIIARTPDLSLFSVSARFWFCEFPQDRIAFDACFQLCFGEPSPFDPCQ